MTHRVFQAQSSELDAILTWVRETLQKHAISKALIKKIELALEEAIVNIIFHAYRDLRGSIRVSFCTPEGGEVLQVTLEDQGIPFNPAKAIELIDPSCFPIERKLGGLGLYFMDKMSDSITYERKGDTNILMLSFRLTS